jgi:hypothetical protein
MGATVAVVVVGTIAPAVAAVDVSSAGHIPAGEAQALQAAGAFGAHPVRFLFVGDSLSVTMGIGLQVGTVHRYGVTVINKGVLGCDIDDLPTISTTNGQQDDPVSPCAHWETLWARQVAQFRPEVVGVLIGRWDILDHVDGDHLVHIGEPAWDRHLAAELDHVVEVLSSHGAHVVLFTMPYLDPPDETNHLLAGVAARHPGTVTVVDLNRILEPSGHYQSAVDGVTVRWADGVHISKQGGEWLQARVLPTIAQLGLDVRAGAGTT